MSKFLFTKLIIVCSIAAQAQVHVRYEPRHHNIFENEFIRILDVHLGPKDTTMYHLHNTPSVFIVLADCKVSSQLFGGQPKPGANVTGTISYDSMNTERIHRVWNEDTSWFHVMDVELTGKNKKTKPEILHDPQLKLLFNEQQANGYSFELSDRYDLQLPPSLNGYLLVSLTGSVVDLGTGNKIQQRWLKAGHYEWIAPGINASITLNGGAAGKFFLLHVK